MIENRNRPAPTLDGNKLVGLVAPTYNGTPETEYDLFGDGTAVERFADGCWTDFLSSNPDVKAYGHHDHKQVLGRTQAGTLKLSVEKRGLCYAIQLPKTTAGKDMKKSVERKDIDGASVSMRNVKAHWSRENGKDIRTITRAELDHISPVADPAYKSTTASLRSDYTEERAELETQIWASRIDTLSALTAKPVKEGRK